MDYKYSFKDFNNETMARAVGRSLPISIKHSVELANAIRGLELSKAKKYLEEVIELKQPVSYRRFNDDLGHKKKMGPGRFPVKTALHFLNTLKLAEANASFKNLSTQDLKIVHINAQRGAGQWHFGRKRRRQFKSSHVEIVVEESVKKDKKEAVKREAGPAAAKPVAAVKTEIKAESGKEEKGEPKVKPAQQKPEKAEKIPVKKEENKKENKPAVKQDTVKEISQSPKQDHNDTKKDKGVKKEKK